MKKSVFLGAAFCCLWTVFSMSASAQLINEVVINPAGTDQPCEYIELQGTPGAALTDLYFVAFEGDTGSTPGVADFVLQFGSSTQPAPVFGSNGLLVVTGTAACGARTYPAETTRAQIALLDAPNGLENGAISLLLIRSPNAPIIALTDYDTNNDGVLELPAGATIVDGIAWRDAGVGIVYGDAVLVTAFSPDAATRFPGNTTPNSSSAFYGGDLTGTNDATTYSTSNRTANFPASGALTPGAPNVGIAPNDAPVDSNGDGTTDYVVVRNTGGGASGQLTWFTKINGGNPTTSREFGIASDVILSGDYDGDRMDDITVYRESNGTFYILLSATLTIRLDQLGQDGDDPSIVGDYDGDGRDDPAVYREGAQSMWFYRTSPNAFFTTVNWGTTGDFVAPGDYDGDGRADYVVQRGEGTAGRFFKRLTSAGFSSEVFGLFNDFVVPGDYDGDGKTDIAVLRNSGGNFVWDFEPSGTAGTTVVRDTWGVGATDLPTQGDYDGDGRTEYSVFRQSDGTFRHMTPGTRRIFGDQWGQSGDFPVAFFNTH